MRILLIVSAFAMSIAAQASAQSAYTSEELVDFFIESLDMGATRGICIGTREECAAPVTPKGLDMRVSFELDSADLTENAKQNLSIFAKMMQDERLEVMQFTVEGHTDARGSDIYNVDLSDARASSVRNFLTDLGVAPERLSAVGLGKSNPRVEDGFDPENRRVELRINLN